jgi:LysR family transcriptional regulator for bpeEF and oprC
MDFLEATRAFVAVVDAGSFARAAERLDVSRPIVTTRVAQLERHLATQLLTRTTRRLALTDDGRAFHARALRILDEVAEAEDAVSGRRTQARGRLRAAMPAAFAHGVLVPQLPRLMARHPELALELVLHEGAPDLAREGLDCAVRAAPVAQGDLVVRRIGTARLVTVASPAYLARRGVPEEPVALERHECIGCLDADTGQPAPWRFEQGGDPIRVAPRHRVAFSGMEAALGAALADVGIAHVFSSVAHGPVMAGRLVPLLAGWTPPGPPVSVVYPGNRYLTARVRAFAEFAQEVFPTETWWRDILRVAARRNAA